MIRPLFGLGALLVLAASGLLLFSDQILLLRLAVLLGLWAALITAIAVSGVHAQSRAVELAAGRDKLTYELELHREVSARREFEIGLAETAHRDATTRHSREWADLREQLDQMNETLAGMGHGDRSAEVRTPTDTPDKGVVSRSSGDFLASAAD